MTTRSRFVPAVEELEQRLATSHVVTITHYFTLTQSGLPAEPILFPPFPYTYLLPPPRSTPLNFFYEPGTTYWGPYNSNFRDRGTVALWTWQQIVTVPDVVAVAVYHRGRRSGP